MGILYSGGKYIIDKESEDHIKALSADAVMKAHKEEYESNLHKFRNIVFKQEVAKMKCYLETKHPDQVDSIIRLRGILNHERSC